MLMKDEKRATETAALRNFFDEQIQFLQEMVGRMSPHIRHHQQFSEEDRQIVESFVDASNARIRAVQGYSRKLREHVRSLYDHVLRIADDIPPPVDLSQKTFDMPPLVNAMFVCSQQVDQLFNAEPELQAFLEAHSKDQAPVVYALLTACKSEKRTFGSALLGDMLVRETPQQTVNFSAHKLHKPCASTAELKITLKNYLFDRVVELIRQEMNARMDYQVLFPVNYSYESRVNSLANPNVYLNTLIEYLEIPSELLDIDKTHIKLSKLGVKLADNDEQAANEFDLDELIWKKNYRDVVLQVSFQR